MPFAGYKNFAACVAANQDKKNPEGYCAEIMRRSEKQVKADIVKINEEERLVFGWANVAVRKDGQQIVDSQNHLIDPADLEFAAYLYVLKFREGDEMHTTEVKAHLVESFIVTAEKLEKMGLAPDALPQGWWVGFYVEDDALWQKVKTGQYRMFSIAGTATETE